MSLISKASRLLTRSGKPLTGFIQCQNYANKNILRNRYRYRNKDGSFRVFNETVDIVPEEFQAQGLLLLLLKLYKRLNVLY
jgi:hypothetical protein